MPRQAQQSSYSFRRQYHHSYSYGLESSSSKYSMKSNTVTISTTANTSLSSLISVESSTEETTTTLAPLSPLATPHHKAAEAAAAALPPPPPENILWSDVKVGAKIGEGNFSTVHKVQLIETTKKKQEDETTPHSPQDKLHQKTNTNTPEDPSLPPRLVLKRAKQSSFDQDIAAEAEIFQRLPEHEHIVRLVGVGRSHSVVVNEEGSLEFDVAADENAKHSAEPTPVMSAITTTATPPEPSDSSQENPDFLILEHLEGGTLHDRLQRLRRQDTRERIREAIASSPSSSSSSKRRQGPRLVSGAKKKIQQLLLSRRKQPQKQSKEEDQQRQVQHQRVHICGLLGLAKALWHVHHHKIAYMDLKPHNVGYSKYSANHKNTDDSRIKSSDVKDHDIADHDDSLVHNETHGGGGGDTVKLFDFGLSQVIVENSSGNNDNCNHKDTTPSSNDAICAGTPRYMAPEILALLGKQQSQSQQQQQQNQRESSSRHTATAADVYSFGVLLWEVATLERPYQRVESLDQLQRALCVRQQRPEIQRVACPELRALLKACWDKDPAARPSMRTVAEQLDQILFRFMGSAPS